MAEALLEQPGRLARATSFVREARAEIRKVTWPTRDELKKATTVILIFVVIVGIVIGLMDLILQAVFVTGVAKLF